MNNQNPLRKIWSNLFEFNWKFALFLILLLGIPRFILTLNANISGNYRLVSWFFVFIWFTPFIFLTRKGRKTIGLKKPNNFLNLLYSFLAGAAFCTIIFFITQLIFGNTISNSFTYISKSYTIPPDVLANNKFTFFLTFATVNMIFSPIGEELLYRGLIHGSFVTRFGERNASFFDSAAFALTHLAHFGIVYNLGKWEFLPFAALVWVLFMFATGQLFFKCKQMSGSILGAIASHAGFNFTMIYLIFYYIF